MKQTITHYAGSYRCRNCGETGRLTDSKPEVIRKCSCGVSQKVELNAQYGEVEKPVSRNKRSK